MCIFEVIFKIAEFEQVWGPKPVSVIMMICEQCPYVSKDECRGKIKSFHNNTFHESLSLKSDFGEIFTSVIHTVPGMCNIRQQINRPLRKHMYIKETRRWSTVLVFLLQSGTTLKLSTATTCAKEENSCTILCDIIQIVKFKILHMLYEFCCLIRKNFLGSKHSRLMGLIYSNVMCMSDYRWGSDWWLHLLTTYRS
jgi:hypothetical protein